MPEVSNKVWNNRRKWLGNLLPALFFFPFASYGVYWMYRNSTIFGVGMWFIVAAVVAGWLALNAFGLVANAFMRRQLEREFKAKGVDFSTPHFFVGFARPKFFSMLDAHEDLGFLFLRDNELAFVGESHQLALQRIQIRQIRFRPNVHTWVGLGRWISVDGVVKEARIRLNIEPRERNFLLLNLLDSKRVRRALESWLKSARAKV